MIECYLIEVLQPLTHGCILQDSWFMRTLHAWHCTALTVDELLMQDLGNQQYYIHVCI